MNDAFLLTEKKIGQAPPVHFSSLFSLSSFLIKKSFATAQLSEKGPGYKILTAPYPQEISSFHGQCLIITPRKFGKAHERNKIRRQIKAIFFEEKLYLITHVSIVLLYNTAKKLSFLELRRIICSGIQKKLKKNLENPGQNKEKEHDSK